MCLFHRLLVLSSMLSPCNSSCRTQYRYLGPLDLGTTTLERSLVFCLAEASCTNWLSVSWCLRFPMQLGQDHFQCASSVGSVMNPSYRNTVRTSSDQTVVFLLYVFSRQFSIHSSFKSAFEGQDHEMQLKAAVSQWQGEQLSPLEGDSHSDEPSKCICSLAGCESGVSVTKWRHQIVYSSWSLSNFLENC